MWLNTPRGDGSNVGYGFVRNSNATTPPDCVEIEVERHIRQLNTPEDFPATFTLPPEEFMDGMFVTWPRELCVFKAKGAREPRPPGSTASAPPSSHRDSRKKKKRKVG